MRRRERKELEVRVRKKSSKRLASMVDLLSIDGARFLDRLASAERHAPVFGATDWTGTARRHQALMAERALGRTRADLRKLLAGPNTARTVVRTFGAGKNTAAEGGAIGFGCTGNRATAIAEALLGTRARTGDRLMA